MDQVTTPPAEDAELSKFGYRQQFTRSLHHFESFAVAFSFISITTGIFTTYAFALATGGTRSVWTWLIVVVGQALVALLYGALSSRIPLSGFSYQWASTAGQPARGLVVRLDVVRVPDHRHGVGRLRPHPGRVPASHRRVLHADQRGTGNPRRTGHPGRADHHLHPRHHPGEQHRRGDGDHRHRRPHRGAAHRRRHPRARPLVQPDEHRVGARHRLLRLARAVHAGHAARRVHDRRVRVGQQPGRGNP